MKNIILKTIIILMLLIVLMPSVCYGDKIIDDFDSYKTTPKKTSSVSKIANNVTGVIATIGSVVSIVILVVVGIRYMLGSVDERSEYKKTIIAYIVGAGMVFAMSFLPMLIYNVAQEIK